MKVPRVQIKKDCNDELCCFYDDCDPVKVITTLEEVKFLDHLEINQSFEDTTLLSDEQRVGQIEVEPERM